LVNEYFKKNYIKFGKTYFTYVLHKLSINPETPLCDDLKRNIDFEFKTLLDKFNNPEFILYSKNDELVMSLSALEFYENDYTKTIYNDINELINEYHKRKQRQKLIINTKDKKLIELESEARKIDSKINNLKVQLNESTGSAKFMDYGNYILEHLSDVVHGQEYLEIDTGDNKIKIKLDTSLTPAMNAQKYYQKYKRQKESISLLKTKIDKFLKEKFRISEEIIKYSKMSDYRELKNLSKSINKEKEEDETSRFRKFILNEDYQVWVGKDSKSNDLLTVKYSAPNDLWFHIRGTSGSHTVLKTGNKNENIDKRIIETAASICAYYSKARNAGTVPVAFCMKKYVKKRKGFKEGSVVMEREKVIFVKPKLPEGSEDISK
jgi:predicted ribosome quality control (RQC) complex YloA/Tae2 family protein